MGVFGAFVLTWPVGREVNPPHLAGVAVAVVNMGGGFLGAALTQGPLGAVLGAGWAGAVAGLKTSTRAATGHSLEIRARAAILPDP